MRLSANGQFIVALIAMAAFIALDGWVISVMWNWFVSPLFAVRQMPISVGIGIDLIATLLLTRNDGKLPPDDGGSALERSILQHLVLVGLVLLFGALLHFVIK